MLIEARDGTTVVLTLNQPEKRNALSRPMREALTEAFVRIEADREVRAVVLTGAGGTFCSGGDIGSMAESSDLAAGRERFRRSHEIVRLMAGGSKPIVAAIEGWAAGAGIGLALCCDTLIAAEDARFKAGFGRIGLVADFGLLHTLPLRVGAGRARQILLYGDTVDAAEAARIGLVDSICPSGHALDRALERAAAIAASAPLAVAYTRAKFAEGLEAALDWERNTQAALMQSADHEEGRSAFMERRAPSFTGR